MIAGAEQLQHFAPGVVLGDVSGPWSAQRILGASRTAHDLARRLHVLDVRYVLVSRRACPPTWQKLPAPPYFELVHEDENAMLWRLRGFRF